MLFMILFFLKNMSHMHRLHFVQKHVSNLGLVLMELNIPSLSMSPISKIQSVKLWDILDMILLLKRWLLHGEEAAIHKMTSKISFLSCSLTQLALTASFILDFIMIINQMRKNYQLQLMPLQGSTRFLKFYVLAIVLAQLFL